MTRTRIGLVIGIAAALVATSAAGAQARSQQPVAGKPLLIGISLSLSGDFSDPGKAAMKGYQLWAAEVNKHGGVLGRKVELKIVDDTSSPTQVVTNYQTLISRDKVDLVFGPFSTLLTAPAARIASRYHYAFVEPAGGGPAVFAEHLGNVFFVQPAPTLNSGDAFVKYILSLPKAERPKTAAYPSLDDPFSSPIADRMRSQFEKAGIKTVFKTIYPPETADLTPIVAKVVAAKPDMVVGGTQSDDAYAQVKAMIQQKFSPKFLFLSNGANSPVEFPSKVGAGNVNGIFSSGDWFPDSKSAGNPAFVAAYLKKYGGDRLTIDSGSAEAYAVGQLIQAVAAKTHSVDNATIIKSLHKGVWPTIEGSLSWDANGSPKGNDSLVEWVGGKLVPVYPANVARHVPTIPKPDWKG
ncbi:MAG: branched-chain amino acid transport system substrate-binding protein [Gaiellaceae bacterium]|nr:branched-chain amino acid transport system substrate-binding protein [Gaiellaceae bacterium]